MTATPVFPSDGEIRRVLGNARRSAAKYERRFDEAITSAERNMYRLRRVCTIDAAYLRRLAIRQMRQNRKGEPALRDDYTGKPIRKIAILRRELWRGWVRGNVALAEDGLVAMMKRHFSDDALLGICIAIVDEAKRTGKIGHALSIKKVRRHPQLSTKPFVVPRLNGKEIPLPGEDEIQRIWRNVQKSVTACRRRFNNAATPEERERFRLQRHCTIDAEFIQRLAAHQTREGRNENPVLRDAYTGKPIHKIAIVRIDPSRGWVRNNVVLAEDNLIAMMKRHYSDDALYGVAVAVVKEARRTGKIKHALSVRKIRINPRISAVAWKGLKEKPNKKRKKLKHVVPHLEAA